MQSIIEIEIRKLRMFNLKFIIFVLLYISASPILPVFLRVALMLLLSTLFIYQKSIISNKILLLILLLKIAILYSLINDFYYMSIYGVNTYSFLYIPFSFLLGLLFLNCYSFSAIMNSYSSVVLVLSVLSLICWFILLLFPSLVNYFFEYTYYETNHKSLIIYNYVSSWRNSGFASEPGLFQFFVSIAAWWNMKYNNDMKKNFIYFLTLISTFSTAGLISLFILLFFKSSNSIKILFLLFSLLFSALLFDLLNYHILNKLSVDSISFQIRFIPLINAFYFIMDNPLGIGSVQYTHIYEDLNIGSWESFGQLGVRYGVFGLLLIITLLFHVAIRDLCLSLLVFLTLITQNIWFLPICSIIFGHYFLNNNNSNRKRF